MSNDHQLRHRAATATQSSTQHNYSHCHSNWRNESSSSSSVRTRKMQQLGSMENVSDASNIHENGHNKEVKAHLPLSTSHHHHNHHIMDGSNGNSSSSSSSHHSNGNGWRNTHNYSSQKESLDGIDEEHGCEHQYERKSSFLLDTNNGGGGLEDDAATGKHNSNGNTMKKHNRSPSPSLLPSSSWSLSATTTSAAIDHGGTEHHHHHYNNNNNNNKSDQRSKTLYFKTAFWITAWYTTSLATLFLNKIVLSRPNSSVHVLGMCQMTTAAVLGGWSTFGGLEYMTRMGKRLVDCFMDAYYYYYYDRCKTSILKNRGADHNIMEESASSSSTLLLTNVSKSDDDMFPPSKSKSTTSAAAASGVGGGSSGGRIGGVNFHFARDMCIVGILRGVTVLLGLVALEHVPVSFVETIKATAPAFTVLFARLILQERTAPQVMLTLLPVVGGLILCSASELRFDSIGFAAAVCNNCADCVQNVMSKRMLAHMKPTQLQFYTSVAALALQTPLILRGVSGLVVRNYWTQHSSGEEDIFSMEDEEVQRHLDTTEDDGELLPSSSSSDYYYHHGEWSLTKLLIVDAIFYHLQSVSAYCTMGCMNPVSQSVANTLKRALLVWASILYFGNPVTSSGIVGIFMVVVGVFLYNHVRRIHQS